MEHELSQVPAEAEQNTPPAKQWRKVIKNITGWIFKKTSHFIGTLIVTIIGGLIVAILIDIFGDFGWLQSIKEFIYNILHPK